MCLVFAQDRKTPGVGIEGGCGARTLKSRERNVRCESRHCRRIGGIKDRNREEEMLLFSEARMEQPSGKGEKKDSVTGNRAKTKEIVNHKVKRSVITKNQEEKREFFHNHKL